MYFKTCDYMDEAACLADRANVFFDANDDKFLGLLLDIAHHLELGRIVVLKENRGEVQLLAYE